jgi:hypothetical protein
MRKFPIHFLRLNLLLCRFTAAFYGSLKFVKEGNLCFSLDRRLLWFHYRRMGFNLLCSFSENLVSDMYVYVSNDLMFFCQATYTMSRRDNTEDIFLNEKPLVMHEPLISPRGILVGMSSSASKHASISSFRLRDCPPIVFTVVQHFFIRLVGTS